MGNSKSSSKSNQTIENNTINQSYLDSLNKTVMNSAVEVLVKNASSCSSSVNQNNLCSVAGSTFGDNLVIGGTQSNTAKVDFSCIQANKASSDMATAMSQSLIGEMKLINDTDNASILNSAANASNSTGFGSTGGSSSAISNSNVTNNVTNETYSTIQNIYEQNLSSNFSSETVSECIGSTSQSNVQDYSNIKAGNNATVNCNQSNSLEQVTKCEQLNEAIGKTLQETAQKLGFKIEADSETITQTEVTSVVSSENVSTGAVQDLGTAASGIINSMSGLLTAFGLAAYGPMIASVILVCCGISLIILVIMVANKIMGSSTTPNNGSLQMNNYPNFSDINSYSDSSYVSPYLPTPSFQNVSMYPPNNNIS